jgi:hypothetical protein
VNTCMTRFRFAMRVQCHIERLDTAPSLRLSTRRHPLRFIDSYALMPTPPNVVTWRKPKTGRGGRRKRRLRDARLARCIESVIQKQFSISLVACNHRNMAAVMRQSFASLMELVVARGMAHLQALADHEVLTIAHTSRPGASPGVGR